jgi:transcriptional regulator with XRE-family HTH domain
MPRKEKADRKAAMPGTFGRLLYDTRRQHGKTIADMAAASDLSPSYLTCIEQGKRSPIPDKVPAMATAYGIVPSDACWSWILTFAPKMMRHLLVDSPFLKTYRQSRMDEAWEWAETEARMEYIRSLADGKTRAECDANFEKAMRITLVELRGLQFPEISGRIEKEYLEDKNDAGYIGRIEKEYLEDKEDKNDAGNTGNDDDRRP